MKEFFEKIFPSMKEDNINIIDNSKREIRYFASRYVNNSNINLHFIMKTHQNALNTKVRSYKKSEEYQLMELFKKNPFGKEFEQLCFKISGK